MTPAPEEDESELKSMIAWLGDAAQYFEARPTVGEDMAHWANVYNAENCRKIAVRLARPLGADTQAGRKVAWQLVPIELTDAMICAFDETVRIASEDTDAIVSNPEDTWRAALAAAPPAPAAATLEADGLVRQLAERAAKISGEQPGKHEWYGHDDARLDRRAALALVQLRERLAAVERERDEAREAAAYWVKHHDKQAALVTEYAQRSAASEATVLALTANRALLMAVITFAHERDNEAALFLGCWLDGSADVDEEWGDWQTARAALEQAKP